MARKTKKATKKTQKSDDSRLAAIQNTIKEEKRIEQNLHNFVAMTAMLLLVLINFLGALLLVPFMLFFEGFQQYAIIFLFAIGFGTIFNLMIHAIEHLGDKHHIIAGIIVPCFAVLDLLILFKLSEAMIEKLSIDVSLNYTLIIALFVGAFLIPYLFDVLRQKHKF